MDALRGGERFHLLQRLIAETLAPSGGAHRQRPQQGGFAESLQTNAGKNPLITCAADEEGLHVIFLKIRFGKAGLPKQSPHGRQGLGFGTHEQRLDRQLGRRAGKLFGHGANLSSRSQQP